MLSRLRNTRGFAKRVLLTIGLALLAMWAPGCMAASLAPLAVQGVGMVADLISGTATGTELMKHQKDKNPDEEEAEADFETDDFNHSGASKPTAVESHCNSLELVTPSIIEFRTDGNGGERWRELGLMGSADAPRWGVMRGQDSAPDGWLPATNLSQMSFTPPLPTFSKPGDGTYLAYAPAQSQTDGERDQLASLVLDFGPSVGTFQYNGRAYDYSTLPKLPCFPTP